MNADMKTHRGLRLRNSIEGALLIGLVLCLIVVAILRHRYIWFMPVITTAVVLLVGALQRPVIAERARPVRHCGGVKRSDETTASTLADLDVTKDPVPLDGGSSPQCRGLSG